MLFPPLVSEGSGGRRDRQIDKVGRNAEFILRRDKFRRVAHAFYNNQPSASRRGEKPHEDRRRRDEKGARGRRRSRLTSRQ